jgi:hypothetical protein
MGGGEKPPMDVLKNWMFEQISFNEASMSHEPVQLQLDTNMTADPNQLDNVLGLVNLPFSAHQESAQSYDWNNTQYVADLVQESFEFMDNTGAVVDESLILASQHHAQAYATSFLT